MINIDKFSKGRLLQVLRSNLKNSKIPFLKIYKVSDWKKNKKLIIKNIKKNFSLNKELIIRSSKNDEDDKDNSQAGKYHSELNVKCSSKSLTNSINKVIKSYGKIILEQEEEFIVQEMIKATSMSGVIFTQDPDNFTPYYLINYDDISGKTSTVTSGNSEFSNKTLSIFREKLNYLNSKRFQKLLSSVLEIEKKLNNNYLDIEFGVNNKMDVFIFQVRRISKIYELDNLKLKRFKKELPILEKKIKKIKLPQKKIYGQINVLGQMPDWNPAEIIGRTPKPFAFSLYRELITKKTWAKAREIMGYRKLKKTELMFSLSGHPYIDTRLSFNSFIPESLPNKIGQSLVNCWLNKLTKNPNDHDKVEFNIATTTYNFNFDKQVKRLTDNLLSKKELKIFKEFHKKQFLNYFITSSKSSIEYCLKQIDELKRRQNEYTKKTSLKKIINDCKNFGIIPFSILARHAFISKSILVSLSEIKIIKTTDIDKILDSISTVASEFLEDIKKVKQKKISKKLFNLKYGHLRPGTYDITSKRYDETNYFNLKDFKLSKKIILKEKNLISEKTIQKIENLIKKEKLKNLNYKILIDYIKNSISLREHAKFIFTKNVSLIIQKIEKRCKKINYNMEDVSFLSLNEFTKSDYLNNLKLKSKINKNKEKFSIFKMIRMPQIISDKSAAYISPYQTNSPNFVTKNKIIGEKLFLSNKFKRLKLENKIIMIENADPGFDWIFTYKIKGLITKFGGINSHMAIRCRELSVPAAIGCGEKLFSDILKEKKIILDCYLNKLDKL